MTPDHISNYKKNAYWLIAISSVVKLLFSSTQEFGNVEAYYWVLSTKLQWNYFDHPPLVAWLIRTTTLNGLLHQELFVRLGAIIASAVCIWLFFNLGRRLANEKTGWYAALLYAASPYASMAAGTFILPDTPQLVFWLWSLLLMTDAVRSSSQDTGYLQKWLLLGLSLGLCIMSKVHGVFLWLGLVIYLLSAARQHFKHSGFYLAATLSLVICLPILIWNWQHDFVTLKFHSARVVTKGHIIDFWRFAHDQMAIIFTTGPIHFFLICRALIWIVRGNHPAGKKLTLLLALCSLPLIVLLTSISIFRETYAHWPGPALTTLLLFPAMQLSTAYQNRESRFPTLLKAALLYTCGIMMLQTITINFMPGTLSPDKETTKFGQKDITLDFYGWRKTAACYKAIYDSCRKSVKLQGKVPLLATDWSYAARAQYYLAQQTGQQVLAIGTLNEIHQYYWMNREQEQLKAGDDAFYVIPSNLFTYSAFYRLKAMFREMHLVSVVPVKRTGLICKYVYVYQLTGYKATHQ